MGDTTGTMALAMHRSTIRRSIRSIFPTKPMSWPPAAVIRDAVRKTAVHAADADRTDPGAQKRVDDPLIHVARQHHLNHADRVAVGDAQALDEPVFLFLQMKLARYVLAAAVNNDRKVFPCHRHAMAEFGEKAFCVKRRTAHFDADNVHPQFPLY